MKILIEGYAQEKDDGWIASSSVTLIKSDNKYIIVDPGCNREKLIAALQQEHLEVEQISFVILTHAHTDHALLCGIFPNAKIITPSEIYNNDYQTEYDSDLLGDDITIIQTPGHCTEHCSVIVKTNNGIYAIAGDVFWWTNDEIKTIDIDKLDDAHPDEVDMVELKKSRQKVLDLADFIIPGHGKVLKNEHAAVSRN